MQWKYLISLESGREDEEDQPVAVRMFYSLVPIFTLEVYCFNNSSTGYLHKGEKERERERERESHKRVGTLIKYTDTVQHWQGNGSASPVISSVKVYFLQVCDSFAFLIFPQTHNLSPELFTTRRKKKEKENTNSLLLCSLSLCLSLPFSSDIEGYKGQTEVTTTTRRSKKQCIHNINECNSKICNLLTFTQTWNSSERKREKSPEGESYSNILSYIVKCKTYESYSELFAMSNLLSRVRKKVFSSFHSKYEKSD